MNAKTSLKVILGLSIAGLLFSGYLSYNELFVGSCATNSPVKCGSWEFADLPACVYGFVMYLAVFTFSVLGLCKGKNKGLTMDSSM